MARGYDATSPVRIWVGSYGYYNEGYLVGDWFSLPMDNDELWAGIKDACKVDRFHEEVGCFDHECDVPGVNMDEYDSIDDLNAMAAALDAMNLCYEDALTAYLDYNGSFSPIEVANIAIDAESIPFYGYECGGDYLSNEYKYGYTMVALNCDLMKLLVDNGIEDYFDYERYGRDYGDVYLTDEGYLCLSGDEPDTNTYTADEILRDNGYLTDEDDEVA